jgi:hypothetical protein
MILRRKLVLALALVLSTAAANADDLVHVLGAGDSSAP